MLKRTEGMVQIERIREVGILTCTEMCKEDFHLEGFGRLDKNKKFSH